MERLLQILKAVKTLRVHRLLSVLIFGLLLCHPALAGKKNKDAATRHLEAPTFSSLHDEVLAYQQSHLELEQNDPVAFQTAIDQIYFRNAYQNLKTRVESDLSGTLESRVARGILPFFEFKNLKQEELDLLFNKAVQYHVGIFFSEVNEVEHTLRWTDPWLQQRPGAWEYPSLSSKIQTVNKAIRKLEIVQTKLLSLTYSPAPKRFRRRKVAANYFYEESKYRTVNSDSGLHSDTGFYATVELLATRLTSLDANLKERAGNRQGLVRSALNFSGDLASDLIVHPAIGARDSLWAGSLIVGDQLSSFKDGSERRIRALPGKMRYYRDKGSKMASAAGAFVLEDIPQGTSRRFHNMSDRVQRFASAVPPATRKTVEWFGKTGASVRKKNWQRMKWAGESIAITLEKSPERVGQGFALVFWYGPKKGLTSTWDFAGRAANSTAGFASSTAGFAGRTSSSGAQFSRRIAIQIGEGLGDVAFYGSRVQEFRAAILKELEKLESASHEIEDIGGEYEDSEHENGNTEALLSMDPEQRARNQQLLQAELSWFVSNLRERLTEEKLRAFFDTIKDTALAEVEKERVNAKALADLNSRFRSEREDFRRTNEGGNQRWVEAVIRNEESLFRLTLSTDRPSANWTSLYPKALQAALADLEKENILNVVNEGKKKPLTGVTNMKNRLELLCNSLDLDCEEFLAESRTSLHLVENQFQELELIEKFRLGELSLSEKASFERSRLACSEFSKRIVDLADTKKWGIYPSLRIGIAKRRGRKKYAQVLTSLSDAARKDVQKAVEITCLHFDKDQEIRMNGMRRKAQIAFMRTLKEVNNLAALVPATEEGEEHSDQPIVEASNLSLEKRADASFVPLDKLEVHDSALRDCVFCKTEMEWTHVPFDKIEPDAEFPRNRPVIIPKSGIRLPCGHLTHRHCLLSRFPISEGPVQCPLCQRRGMVPVLVLDPSAFDGVRRITDVTEERLGVDGYQIEDTDLARNLAEIADTQGEVSQELRLVDVVIKGKAVVVGEPVTATLLLDAE